MGIIERESVFNDNFRIHTKNDTTNYLGKLLDYASETEDIENVLTERSEVFQNELLEYVLSKETDTDYESDIDEVRKSRVENLLYDINNYLMSIKPYDGVKTFIECDFKELFNKSEIYCDSYRKRLLNKINTIKENTKLEYDQNISYKSAIDKTVERIVDRTNEIIFYDTMAKSMVSINKETSLYEFEEYIDSLLIESSIISKYDTKSRLYITNTINKAVQNQETGSTAHYFANICESILTNYVLLDLYSNNPETLKISDKMLESIFMEVDMGSVTKEDLTETLVNGPIKFNVEEMNYINRTFMKRLFHQEDKKVVVTSDLVKLIK